jgi:glycolate oxidase FAD binding subunit
VQDVLAQHGQMLPFEPLVGNNVLNFAGSATIGGVVATNSSGPRRVAAGACRDSLLGVRLVNGRGEIVKSGGKVMKNVTGFDLVKLVCGAWGTLGVISEVVLKVLPKPERSSSVCLRSLDDEAAVQALSQALGAPFEVTGAAHLPGGRFGESLTIVRVEGFESSVKYRLKALVDLLRTYGEPEPLPDEVSHDLWVQIGECTALENSDSSAVWRLSVAPSKAAAVTRALRELPASRYFFDWGGNLIWFSVGGMPDGGAGKVRGLVKAAGGHATLFKAPPRLRESLEPFEPLSPALRRLTIGIKDAFDPDRILNPGRMYSGV